MTSFEYIEPRTRVEIHGIKAKPELNGRVGTVMEYVPARARYRVRVSDGDDGATTGGGKMEEVYSRTLDQLLTPQQRMREQQQGFLPGNYQYQLGDFPEAATSYYLMEPQSPRRDAYLED